MHEPGNMSRERHFHRWYSTETASNNSIILGLNFYNSL